MAIKEDNSAEQTGNHNFTEEPKAVFNSKFSFHNSGFMTTPLSRGVGSEYYTKMKAGLTEKFKEANPEVEIALIDINTVNEPAMAFGAIIVAARLKSHAKAGVAYHILLLEATGDKLQPVFENYQSQQIEVMRVPSDAIDDVLVGKALEKVKQAFQHGPWYMVDGTVVPESFNPEDKTAMHNLALNAGMACTTELGVHIDGFRDLNLIDLANDSTLNINISFGRQTVSDVVGNPMRSDIVVNFASKRNNVQGGKYGSVNNGDKEIRVSEVNGYLDLVWAPVNPANGYNPYNQQAQLQTQRYAAYLVITNLASNYASTTGSILLALATAATVRDDNNWIQSFRPSAIQNGDTDITDIGMLNVEANLDRDPSGYGKYVDTKADNFKLEDLGMYVSALVTPGLIIGMDCPEQGPQSWYTSIFAAASNGSPAAYRVIYDAANQLTNGAFSKYFPNGSVMFVNQGNRVHLGSWTDRQGNKRDIRDIDHVAVCCLTGERNPGSIRDWSDTFTRTQYPQIQRLAARKRMISSLTGETAKFTGFAQRVTFAGAFMEALARGIKETGMPVRINTPLSGADFNNQRGVAGFASAAMLAPGQTFQQANVFGGFQNNFGNMNNYGNQRW